jgi:hypothetical protein
MNTRKRWSGVRTRGKRSLTAEPSHYEPLPSNRDPLMAVRRICAVTLQVGEFSAQAQPNGQ